jgi:cell division protein FtsZ
VEVAVAQTRHADPVEESPSEQPAEAERELIPVAASAGTPAPQAKRTEAKQEQMLLDPVARGRVERSEPTIVDGQDLDVPTFLRRNVKVK